MDFDDNLLGELRVSVPDPLDVIPDPDAKTYNPSGWSDVIVTRWLTADEIEALYGAKARKIAEASGSGQVENADFGEHDVDVTERNKFGGMNSRYDAQFSNSGIVRYRIVDRQKWVRERASVAIHPSGDVRMLGGDETPEALAEMQANGIQITKRMIKKVW